MNHNRPDEVSYPAKNRFLLDFGDEALDSSGLFIGVCQTVAVAKLAAGSISQSHVNCMPHEVIAVFRGFAWFIYTLVFNEGTAEMILRNKTGEWNW